MAAGTGKTRGFSRACPGWGPEISSGSGIALVQHETVAEPRIWPRN